jgi:hypothetical protein
VNFHGEKRSNETHRSATDPEARLARKSRGTGAVLAYRGYRLTENRNGLVVAALATQAYGSAERDAALRMAESLPGTHRVTLGADRGYNTRDLVAELRGMPITPHVAQNDTRRRSAVDERATRHFGYQISQRARKRIEEVFGWMKTVGQLRKVRHRGVDLVGWMFTFTAAAYNLVRMRNLLSGAPRPQCAWKAPATAGKLRPQTPTTADEVRKRVPTAPNVRFLSFFRSLLELVSSKR